MVYTIQVNTKNFTIDNASEEKRNKVISLQQKAMNLISTKFIYLNGLCSCFFVLVIGVLFSAPVILLPQHNTLIDSKYWYEAMIVFDLTMPWHWMAGIYFENKMHLRIDGFTSMKSCIRAYLSAVVTFQITHISFYVLWTSILGFNYPMPFNIVSVYSSCIPFIITLWYNFPIEVRKNEKGRKRMYAFMLYIAWHWCFAFQYSILAILFQKIPSSFQWILVIILPLQRELNIFLVYKLYKKFSHADELVMKSFLNIHINAGHSLFLVIKIGSMATDVTTYLILSVEFMINLHSCYKIFKLHSTKVTELSQIHQLESKKEEEVQMLVVCEMMEILVPLVYLSTFFIAYYGPNANILGNIRNEYWQFTAVKDVEKLIINVFKMFFIDLCSILIGGMFLWKLCGVNLLFECCRTMNSYWKIISVYVGQEAAKV